MAEDKKVQPELDTEIATRSKDPYETHFMGVLTPNDPVLLEKGGPFDWTIYRDLRRDGKVFGGLQKRGNALIGRPWQVVPLNDDAAGQAAAAALTDVLQGVMFDQLCRDLMDAMLVGFSVVEVIWTVRNNLVVPKRFVKRAQRRFRFVDMDDQQPPSLRMVTAQDMLKGVELPERKFLVHRVNPDDDNPYGTGLGSQLYWPVLFKRKGVIAWNKLNDRFGAPTPWGKYAKAFFEAKGEAISWDWHELLRQQHGQVFTVAKATSIDVLRAIRDQVSKAVGEGQTLASFKRNLKPQLQALGWWGKQEVLDANTGELTAAQLGSDRRLRTIFQTNVQTAYMAGRFQRLVGNAGDRPFWMYVAVMDGRTRPAHAALNGRVFRWDDPIWKVIFPPNGWGCRCRVRALTAAEVDQMGLNVESGAERIVSKEVQLGKDGPTVTVQGISGVGSRSNETFWPDPGWDYNPGLQVDQDQAISAVLADKVVQIPAPIGAEAAQAILADDSAAQLLDRAWQGWVDEVTSDSAVRGRTQVLGYLRKSDAVAAFAKVADMSAAISVADAMVLSAAKAAGSRVTRQTLDGLSSAMRSPVAVLWDKARSAMVYVTAAEAGRLTLITLGSRPARIASEALVQSIASISQAELKAAVGAGLFEVMAGAV